MPLTLCHGDLMDTGKHALDHPSLQQGIFWNSNHCLRACLIFGRFDAKLS